MRDITQVNFEGNRLIIQYVDNTDPKWAGQHQVIVHWEKDERVKRLAHTGWHVFNLLVEYPQLVEKNDEVLTEWLGRLFDEHPTEGHNIP